MPTVDYEERLSKLWNTVQDSNEISDRNQELFSRFKRDLRTEDYSAARIHKLLSHLKILAEWADFDFDDATEDDLRDAVAWIQSRGNSAANELDYKVVIKRFWKWLNDGDLKRTADRADIQKDVTPYQFRHSRATHLANRFTEAQMCEWFGWVQGSRMPAKYVHLAGRDIDQAYGQLHGKVDESSDDEKVTNKRCARCNLDNRAEARFCDRCGAPLDVETATTFHQEEADAKKKLVEQLSPQELQELLMEGLAAQGDD